MSEIDEFIKTRDASLISLDLGWAREMMPEVNNDIILLAAMHKSRYEVTSINDKLRLESAAWLRNNGFTRMDGSELLPEGQLPE